MIMKRAGLPLLLLLSVVFLAGCSGVKPYPDMPNKNVHLRTKLDDKSVMTSIHADLDIFGVDARCETKYIGSVELVQSAADIGIPTGQLSYLRFVFSSKGMLGGVSGSTSYETLLRPRAGHEYRVDVRYVDDIYNVTLLETMPGAKGGRELAQRRLETCRSEPRN
jgi:hypothetical protein